MSIKAAQTNNFATPVKPVVDYISYDYSATNKVPYANILTVGENRTFAITNTAPLDETATITINVGHIKKDGTHINDAAEMNIPVTVASRTFTVTTVLNGGQLIDANGTSRESFECVEDALIFEDLTVQKTGYLFEGWYLDAAFSDDQKYSDDGSNAVMPSKNITLYAKWKAHSFNLTFDGNGGTVSETTRLILCDTEFGELPTPERVGYTFDGWFTGDGAQIFADTTMATAEDVTVSARWTIIPYKVSWNTGTGYTIGVNRTSSPNANASIGELSSGATIYYGDTLAVTYTKQDYYSISKSGITSVTVTGNVDSSSIYASAELNPVSGWVSSLPDGAQVVNTKWSYVLREYKEHSEPELAGWFKYDTQRTSWGAWSGWSTVDPSNGVRNVESRSVYDHTEFHYYRWTNGKGGVYTYKYDSSYWLEERWFTYELPVYDNGSQGTVVRVESGGNYKNRWIKANYSGNYSTDKTFSRDIYRTEWRYQDPIYTYYFCRDIALEATYDPTGQANVSNVQKWVQYRAK